MSKSDHILSRVSFGLHCLYSKLGISPVWDGVIFYSEVAILIPNSMLLSIS